MSINDLQFLERWFAAHVDGDWEHRNGITLGTLDNPGWSLTINLSDTELQGQTYERPLAENGNDDWLQVQSDGKTFYGACGTTSNLLALLAEFRRFASQNQEPVLHREEHMTKYTSGTGTEHWLVVNAPSQEAILLRYPELEIIEEPPWLPKNYTRADRAGTPYYWLEEEPHGVLQIIVNERQK